jgi:hypothetical protein
MRGGNFGETFDMQEAQQNQGLLYSRDMQEMPANDWFLIGARDF